MDDLFAARSQMAMSLAFHILFAAAGVAMPLLMVMAEWRWLRTGDQSYLTLTKRWSKGTAILFAVGAVSGTVLSFELGLLWPGFMKWAGAIIGMPFSLEGFAFFTEAIFLGIYLYGWQRVSPRMHLFAGVVVAVSGAASALFVVIANGWMNTPTGFRLENGQPVDIDPIAAMMNPAAFGQSVHMLLAAYAATGFAVAGIHAFILLRNNRSSFHRHALEIALLVGGVAAIRQALSRSWWAWPLQIATAGVAVGAIMTLWQRRFRVARIYAALQVTLILWGWGYAQFPYLVVADFTIHNSAAPIVTLRLLWIALLAGTLLLFPSSYYLYRVFKTSEAKLP